MDVLRPLPLGELALGPREVEVEPGVERVLRRRHPGLDSPWQRRIILGMGRIVAMLLIVGLFASTAQGAGTPAPCRRSWREPRAVSGLALVGALHRAEAFDHGSAHADRRGFRTVRSPQPAARSAATPFRPPRSRLSSSSGFRRRGFPSPRLPARPSSFNPNVLALILFGDPGASTGLAARLSSKSTDVRSTSPSWPGARLHRRHWLALARCSTHSTCKAAGSAARRHQ